MHASDMIREAVAATQYVYGTPPALGMITFINRRHVQPVKVRGRPTWGRTWELAGFRHVGETKGGLLAFQLDPADMPGASAPVGGQGELFALTLPSAAGGKAMLAP